jgi:predicted ATPase
MSRPQVMQLSLLPLSPGDAAALARSIIASDATNAKEVDAIVARAEGNPFFIEELTLSFGAGRAAPESDLPESIVDVLRSRIFALGASARRVLVTASVMGRTCPLHFLRTLLPTETDLEEILDELARVELVHVTTRGRERTLTFRHAMTHLVAYGLLSANDRRTLHGTAARTLEATHQDRNDEAIELLA